MNPALTDADLTALDVIAKQHNQKRGRRYVPSDAMRRVANDAREAVHRKYPVHGDPYEVTS